jgi:DNA-binding NtrC family response regulator
MVVLARSSRLSLDDLPPAVRKGPEAREGTAAGLDLPPGGVRLVELERRLIRQALRRAHGRLRPAARLLGISYKTLQYRIRKHGLEPETRDAVGQAPPGGAEGEP